MAKPEDVLLSYMVIQERNAYFETQKNKPCLEFFANSGLTRDMGTAVFPDAPLKIFLVADPWERARRRLTQRLGRRPTDEEVAEETDVLVQRDAKDATQTVQAKDAVLLDTTYLTQPEQVERIVALAYAVSHRPTDT